MDGKKEKKERGTLFTSAILPPTLNSTHLICRPQTRYIYTPPPVLPSRRPLPWTWQIRYSRCALRFRSISSRTAGRRHDLKASRLTRHLGEAHPACCSPPHTRMAPRSRWRKTRQEEEGGRDRQAPYLMDGLGTSKLVAVALVVTEPLLSALTFTIPSSSLVATRFSLSFPRRQGQHTTRPNPGWRLLSVAGSFSLSVVKTGCVVCIMKR